MGLANGFKTKDKFSETFGDSEEEVKRLSSPENSISVF